jgi:histidine ammonia-lyase
MHDSSIRGRRPAFAALLLAGAAMIVGTVMVTAAARAEQVYKPINPTMANQTITLTGHDLTIEQVVAVARYGAKVQLSPEAKQREADNYGLLLEAATEGVAVYWFNRGAGDQRETVMFSGDPMSAENKPKIERSLMMEFRSAFGGYGPEVSDEEIVRAMMVVRANAMTWNAPSPQLAQMLTDLLNKRVTPVVEARGTLGEGDLAQLGDVGSTMVGAGDAYCNGMRMSAADALKQAGLSPIQPFGADNNALTSSDAYATGQAALLAADAKDALDWADMAYAMDLTGMNSSITPLSLVVQADRPFAWLNWDAARVLDWIKGSYLFGDDPKRIIQDPESLRASSIRQASAWEAWASLRHAVSEQLNSSDHNPAVHADLGPSDSWELATPQMMKYYIKGGPQSHGKHGYIVSNANWDPYPMANVIENLTLALANMDVAVTLRIDRFSNPFFTVVNGYEVLPAAGRFFGFGGYEPADLWQDIEALSHPIEPQGQAIVSTVEDLEAQTRLKVVHARAVVDDTFALLAQDVLTAAYWMDVRKAQDSTRDFGRGPTAAWTALRKAIPLNRDPSAPPPKPVGMLAADFMVANPISTLVPGGPAMPAPEPLMQGTAKLPAAKK